MQDLFDLLGYRPILKELSEGLGSRDRIQLLAGPPGVGKSWLLRAVGQQWQAEGGVVALALGDSGRGSSPLHPLGYALGALSDHRPTVGLILDDVTQIAEQLLGTSGTIRRTVSDLASIKSRKRHRRFKYLGAESQQILSNLERLGKKRPLLLLADNLHWWDAESLCLLRELISADLRSTYPFLDKMRLVCAETEPQYQAVLNQSPHDDLIAAGHARTLKLPRVPKDRFLSILRTLGAPDNLNRAGADEIYRLSGGHLVLARRAAEYLATEGMAALSDIGEAEDFKRLLFSERLHALGTAGREVSALLQVASIIGLTFQRREILCAYPGPEENTSAILRKCRDENVIEFQDELCRFSHDIYRQHFTDTPGVDSISIYERLMSCLRALRPGDYISRCLNAIHAEKWADAGVLGVQAELQAARNGRHMPSALAQSIRGAISDSRLDSVLTLLMASRHALQSYDFEVALRSLDRLPHGLDQNLRAEADYLRAMCLMSTRSEVDREEGRKVLFPWIGLEDVEAELGFRLMRQLLYGLAMQPNKSEARNLERRVRLSLEMRASYDIDAEDSLYILDRSSGSLEPPEVSLIRVREATDHFAPSEGESALRNPLEYYRCLVNYGAKLISNSDYREACDVHSKAVALVHEYTPDTFPRVEFLLSNQVLAEYRAGYIAASAAATRERDLIEQYGNDRDRYYLNNSLAVFEALADNAVAATEILRANYDHLMRKRDPEPSMQYTLLSNLTMIRYLAGEEFCLAKEWDSLLPCLNEVAYTAKTFLVRRHTLFRESLPVLPHAAPELDVYVVSRHPNELGRPWDNFGRGFRVPEVEFWREN